MGLKVMSFRACVSSFCSVGINRFNLVFQRDIICLKGQGHLMETNFFRNDDFAVFLIGHITVIFHYFSQNESVALKMDSCTS